MSTLHSPAFYYNSGQVAVLEGAGGTDESIEFFQEAEIPFETALKCFLSGVEGHSAVEFLTSGISDVTDMKRLESVWMRGSDVAEYRNLGFTDLDVDRMHQLALTGFLSGHARMYREAGVEELEEMVSLFSDNITSDDYTLYCQWGFTDREEMRKLRWHSPAINGWTASAFGRGGIVTLEEMCQAAREMSENGATLHDIFEVRNELAIYCGVELSEKIFKIRHIPKNIFEVSQQSPGIVRELEGLTETQLRIVVQLLEEQPTVTAADVYATVEMFR